MAQFTASLAPSFDGPDYGSPCWHTVKRTTVKLPDDLDVLLRDEAARRGSTIADVTREAIEPHFGSVSRRRLIAAKAGGAAGVKRRAAPRRSFGKRPVGRADRRFRLVRDC